MLLSVKFLTVLLSLGVSVLTARAAPEPLRVVTLHTVLTEIARDVGGAHVTVTPLLRPGTDPHQFEPAPADIARLRQAELVLAAGLGLESYLGRLQRELKPGILLEIGAVLPNPLRGSPSEAVHHHEPGHDHDHDKAHAHEETDPHWWHSLDALQGVVDIVARQLTVLRPDARADFEHQAATVRARLASLQAWARAKVETLPAGRRVLVTSHDAFGYLAREFGFTVFPLLGSSTVDEASARHVAATIQLIRRNQIRAVFTEASSSPRLLETIVRETKARLGRPLWADGLGTEPENATIEAMFRHNLTAIVDGLSAD